MSSIGAMAARRFSSKPRVTVTEPEPESVIVMLPDGSIRLFENAHHERLTAQAVLSEYPTMGLSSLESLVSPTAPLVPGETYFLTPKRPLSATRPPLTPPSQGRPSSGSRGVSPSLPPRSPRDAASDGQIPLTDNGLHRRQSSATSELTRASSPGCCSVQSDESGDLRFVARGEFGSGRRPGLGSERGAEDAEEDSLDQPGLYKSKTYHHSNRQSRKGSGPLQPVDFAKQIELSPHRGESRRNRSPFIVPSPTSSVSSVTSQRGEHRLPPRPSPPPTPNPILAELAALDEDDYSEDIPTVNPVKAASTAPPHPEGSSIKAKVLATLAHLKPRRLRRFTSPGKKHTPSHSADIGGADVIPDLVRYHTESAEGWADVDSQLFMMTDTRIGQRRPRTRGGGAHYLDAGYAQQGVAWEAPSQVTWGDDRACDSRTFPARPDAYSRPPMRSPSPTAVYGASPGSRICRSCNGVSSCCTCESEDAPDCYVRPAPVHYDMSHMSQGLSQRRSPATMQRLRDAQFDDFSRHHRSNAEDSDEYIMPPSNQRFLSGPIGRRAVF